MHKYEEEPPFDFRQEIKEFTESHFVKKAEF